MKYLLEGGFAVGQEEVHALAAKPALPDRLGESAADTEHVRARFRIQFPKECCVVFGDNQQVSRINRTGVHESEHAPVFEDDIGGHTASYDLAKEAVAFVRDHRGILPSVPRCPARARVNWYRGVSPYPVPGVTLSK